jgi:hypothetical protein
MHDTHSDTLIPVHQLLDPRIHFGLANRLESAAQGYTTAPKYNVCGVTMHYCSVLFWGPCGRAAPHGPHFGHYDPKSGRSGAVDPLRGR